MANEFCLKMPDFHVTFRDLLHAVNLRHGTGGFTSPPKEGVLRIFSPWKIQPLRWGLNPRTWVPKASTIPLDHRSRLEHPLTCNGASSLKGREVASDLSSIHDVKVPVHKIQFCLMISLVEFINSSFFYGCKYSSFFFIPWRWHRHYHLLYT